MLSVGSAAPRFEIEDAWGVPVRLENFAGRPVLLSFFRNAACAICNLRIHQLIERYPAFESAGLEVLAVFESPAERMRDGVGKQDVPFMLIADPDARLYEQYGVEVSETKVEATMAHPGTPALIEAAAQLGFASTPEEGSNFNRIPADFLIGPDGRIAVAHYGEVVTDHLPLDQIEAYLGLVMATT